MIASGRAAPHDTPPSPDQATFRDPAGASRRPRDQQAIGSIEADLPTIARGATGPDDTEQPAVSIGRLHLLAGDAAIMNNCAGPEEDRSSQRSWRRHCSSRAIAGADASRC
jgi:hypothetical protein